LINRQSRNSHLSPVDNKLDSKFFS